MSRAFDESEKPPDTEDKLPCHTRAVWRVSFSLYAMAERRIYAKQKPINDLEQVIVGYY